MSFPAVMRTPVPCWVASRVRTSRVWVAHLSTRSRGSASHGPHNAPAAAEVVAAGGSAVRTSTRRPRSARVTAVVKPITPAPSTATSPVPDSPMPSTVPLSGRLCIGGKRGLQGGQEARDVLVAAALPEPPGQDAQHLGASARTDGLGARHSDPPDGASLFEFALAGDGNSQPGALQQSAALSDVVEGDRVRAGA